VEGVEVIAIVGLRMLVDRLSRLDIVHAEVDALEQAALALEAHAKAKAMASAPTDEGGTSRRARETAASAAISHHINEHSAAIGAIGSAAVTRELGSITKPPDPILGAAARQFGPAVAEHIGQMIAQLMSEMLND
jgi:hypothetical protein